MRAHSGIWVSDREKYMKNAFGKDVLGFLVDVYWNILELAERSS